MTRPGSILIEREGPQKVALKALEIQEAHGVGLSLVTVSLRKV